MNNRNERHVGICGNGDRAKEFRCELGGDEDGRRAVCTADDADGAGLCRGEAEQDSADIGNEDTELCGSAEQQALRVCNQRTEVCHAADADEDETRINTELNAEIEDVEQTSSFRGTVCEFNTFRKHFPMHMTAFKQFCMVNACAGQVC